MEKDMKIALVISFIFTGLGIAYLGDVKKGVTLFGAAVALNILGMWTFSIFSHISILVWILGLYLTFTKAQSPQ
ncbi:hypothetical protein [uncultured Methanobrevibacter sp.]|uniref:hypothetical protein n=1 Tax=uncultured Methanobrevibacter sp. TaxID=253161 RepID=UPI00260E21F8|nr:hypothetical protein [uncultured Methanobrevibacter sp.]